MTPLIQPQEEEDDSGQAAERHVDRNAQCTAGFFRVQSVEPLASAILHVQLDDSFRRGVESFCLHFAETRPPAMPSLPAQ